MERRIRPIHQRNLSISFFCYFVFFFCNIAQNGVKSLSSQTLENALKCDDCSMAYWDSIIVAAQKNNLPSIEAKALKRIADIYNFKDNKSKAFEFYEKSIETIETTGNQIAKLELLYEIVEKNIYFNNFQKAMEDCYTGMEIAQSLQNKEKLADFQSRIGTIHFHTSNFSEALELHLKALETYKTTDNKANIVSALCDVASDYGALNDQANSAKYYFQTAKYKDDFGYSIHTIEINKALSTAYNISKKVDSAIICLNTAYKIADTLKLISKKASILSMLAQYNFQQNNFSLAKDQALQSVKLCEVSHFNLQLPSVLLLLKKIYLKENNYQEALKITEMYTAVKDSLSIDEFKRALLKTKFDFEVEKKDAENELLVLKLKQDRYLFGLLIVILIFITVIIYFYLQQEKMKTEQRSAQLENKLLLSQMNPHFIFNALQAIQNFILKSDAKTAISYLGSFSNVMRSVLENSRVDTIALNKEIQLLEHYLKLQMMRFGQRFTYHIQIDIEIEQSQTKIIPMLAQPFIENAIEHGFKSIESGGLISIRYFLTKDYLLMEISDNGVGITSNEVKHKDHQSMAIAITKERIALHNKKIKQKIQFEVSEAFPDKTERKGVKIVFKIPTELLA
jgi:anti-sigma regulatory factor (Ser/Thr protein kinase)